MLVTRHGLFRASLRSCRRQDSLCKAHAWDRSSGRDMARRRQSSRYDLKYNHLIDFILKVDCNARKLQIDIYSPVPTVAIEMQMFSVLELEKVESVRLKYKYFAVLELVKVELLI